MLRFRRLLPVIAALVAIALVASPADAKKKKKKKPPVAQQGIAGSVSIPFHTVGLARIDGLDSTFFEFDWTDKDNARAEIEATFSPGPGVDPVGLTNNDVDIYIYPDDAGSPGEQMDPPAECSTPDPNGSGCSAVNGSELLALPKLPIGHYHLEFNAFIIYTVNINVDFTITFFNAAGKPGPAPAPA